MDIQDAVSPQNFHFVRKLTVSNLKDIDLDMQLFFTHDLRIAESDVGDTAFYHPFSDAIIHYKRSNYFMFGGSTALGGIHEYATGIKDFGNLEGTWRDAEDGHLSGNAIAQGSVDSTFSLKLRLAKGEQGSAYYWMVCGSTLENALKERASLIETGIERMISETAQYWRAWVVGKIPSTADRLPPAAQRLFTQSLFIIRSHVDNAGAVIAANDSDIMQTNRANYSYMWPRDGAFVSTVMDRIGFQDISRNFYQFCRSVLKTDPPVLMHKYGPDGTLGASWHPWTIDANAETPFQEDETALTIHSLWRHYEQHRDLEFLNSLFEPFVVPTCDFMEEYRDPKTGLPLPSWDLWEERRGIHTFTVCAVASAMKSAAKIARALGADRAAKYGTACEEIEAGLLRYLFDDKRGVFFRRLTETATGDWAQDLIVDSSVLATILMHILPATDPRALSTIGVVEKTLSVRSQIGGIARYEGDYYFRQSDGYPGNPWIICTLWLAQAKILAALTSDDLQEPLGTLEWAARHSATSGVLPEQLHPDSGLPLSVSPLTWSHAEYVNTVLEYLTRHRQLAKP